MKLLAVFSFVLFSACLLRSPPADKKFTTFDHGDGGLFRRSVLVDKVHAPYWNIAYSYGDDCSPEAKDNDEALTAAIGKAIRTWLQPLRDYSNKRIVADFRYHLVADPHLPAEDLWVVFHCGEVWRASALISNLSRPVINIRSGTTQVKQHLMASLVYEMGHAFGLASTYVPVKQGEAPSTGGLRATRGTQPASVMSGHMLALAIDRGEGDVALGGIATLGKDDINGIVWLYKHRHEGLPLEKCFFPEYELEEAPGVAPTGCRPKYPLIFEIKQGQEHWALEVLKDDPDIDINAQDKDGLTALHHAVLKGYEELAAKLIAHQDIKPFLKNADGHSALDLARQLELPRIAALIAAHPKAAILK